MNLFVYLDKGADSIVPVDTRSSFGNFGGLLVQFFTCREERTGPSDLTTAITKCNYSELNSYFQIQSAAIAWFRSAFALGPENCDTVQAREFAD